MLLQRFSRTLKRLVLFPLLLSLLLLLLLLLLKCGERPARGWGDREVGRKIVVPAL